MRSSSATVLNYFHIMYQSISSIEQLQFSFPSNFFMYQFDFCVFWPVWALHTLNLPSVTFHGVSIFVLSRMLWMLVNVGKAKFPLWEISTAFSKIPGLRKMLVAVYKTEFTSWKKLKASICSLNFVIIIFSKAHGIQKFRLD